MNILKKIKKDISKAKIIVNNDKTATIKFNTSYSEGQKEFKFYEEFKNIYKLSNGEDIRDLIKKLEDMKKEVK